MVILKRKRLTGQTSDNNNEGGHIALPQYAPFIPFNSPDLQREKYKPRDLLNFTVKAFHSRRDVDLSLRQRTLRDKFIKVFNNRKSEYGNTFDDAQLESYERDMRDFVHGLDGFFFFGCLERHIEIDLGMDMESPSGSRSQDGYTIPSEVESRYFIKIGLNLGRGGQVYDLAYLAGILGMYSFIFKTIAAIAPIVLEIHEIVHAWYMYFSCVCEECDRDRLNTTGHPSDAHGPLYLMLHRLLVTEIRRWHPTLKDFLAHDCPNDEVSRVSKKMFQEFMGSLDVRERKKYNRIRSLKFGPQLFVRLTDDGKVIVRPQLKHNQLNQEDALRGEVLRQKELAEELAEYEVTKNQRERNNKAREENVNDGADNETEK
ncbi:hypothetical protein F5Y10DRAFT_273679 [Nemania abortiva]|nr:hypothetical protein F5Y10DRAFT_273679 [Nemania abortiva]